MPVVPRSVDTIRKAIQGDIASLNAGYDVLSGPIKDLAIDPEAIQFNYVEQQISYASMMLSLANAVDIAPGDLDAYGANFGLKRGLGSYASGPVVFETTSAPVSDITIPAGTACYITGTSKAFLTNTDVTMYAALAPSYYNPYRGRWGVAVQVTASSPGSDYNTAAGTIQSIGTTITGITGCYNPADITGGTDIPTNSSYAQAILSILGGSDRSSVGGCMAEVAKNFPQVIATSVIQGSDPLITRIANGVPRDIYITGSIGTQVSQTFTVSASGEIVFASQPVDSILGVFNTTTGSQYVAGTDFSLLKDTGPVSGSIYASDALFIPAGSSIPNSTITVIYTQNQTVGDVQAFYDTPGNTIEGTDILVREGIPVNIYISIRMTILPGYVLSDVQSAVVSFLLNALNTNQFGDDVTAITPDTVRLDVLNNVNGISTFLFSTFSTSGTPGDVESIILARNQYCLFDSTTLQWS
jgi:hypothetical protein